MILKFIRSIEWPLKSFQQFLCLHRQYQKAIGNKRFLFQGTLCRLKSSMHDSLKTHHLGKRIMKSNIKGLNRFRPTSHQIHYFKEKLMWLLLLHDVGRNSWICIYLNVLVITYLVILWAEIVQTSEKRTTIQCVRRRRYRSSRFRCTSGLPEGCTSLHNSDNPNN